MPPLRESAADSSGAVSTSKIVGPTRPPTQLQSENEHLQPENNTDSSDSSDDDFGPQLPPSGNTASTRPETQAESRVPRSTSGDATDAAATRKRQRDDWMLKPPENSSWASGMNPTAIKNRKFTSGRSVRGDRNTDGASSVWTEDPAQKRQRLENEVLGIKSESSTSSARSKDLSTRTNQATAEKLKSLTVSPNMRHILVTNSTNFQCQSSTAKSSLYESQKKEKQKVEEDDPSKRAFDYEKDVAGKTSISSGARKKLINQASDFTSRFSGGKYI